MQVLTPPASFSTPPAATPPQLSDQFHIDVALHDARCVVNELIAGKGCFAKLSANKRMAHLASLFARTTTGKRRCDFTDLPNEDLITLAGEAADEIARRLGSVSPKPVAAFNAQPVREFSFTAPTEISPEDRDAMEATIEVEPWDELT